METGGYKALVEEAREALFGLTEDGVIATWNRGAEEAYGYPRTQAIGTPLVELTIPDREVQQTRELIASARHGGVVRARSMRKTKHGALLHVDAAMSRVTTESGYVFIAVSELDVTRAVERDGLETKLEEVRRLKSEFLANMSHELRTPLNSIIGFAELMHKGKTGPMAADHVEYLGDIIASSRRLLTLVNDVLDLAKLESGKIDYHPVDTDLLNLVQETRDILKGLINEKRLHVRIEIADEARTVLCDPGRIKQVVYTLLSNAVKFTNPGGDIGLTIHAGEHEWMLEVKDTGIGIAPDDLPRLFVEFPRISTGITREGTGLGLALAQRIVEGHGGKLEAVSTLGVGSAFTATIPKEPPFAR